MVDDSALLQRRERTELIALADADELVALAEALLGRLGQPTVVTAPEVGLVMMTVREPVCGDRFHLGEVLVTRAEADWGGTTGWAIRMGADRETALAAALCDAAALIDEAAATEVDDLCRRTRADLSAAKDREWATLVATEVQFEELD